MTSLFIVSMLSAINTEAKRKNNDLRRAATQTLTELKTLSSSDVQFAREIFNRPDLISPFLLACQTKNEKLISPAIECIQRLSVARALPTSSLNDVVEALRSGTSTNSSIQLKILQILPFLAQNYPEQISGNILNTIWQVCSCMILSKFSVVSSTASATFQQLLINTYERLRLEDESPPDSISLVELTLDDFTTSVYPHAFDAFKLFHDLSLISNHKPSLYIPLASIPISKTLEFLEFILKTHSDSALAHQEQAYVLHHILMPCIIKILSDNTASFPYFVLASRILSIVLEKHLAANFDVCCTALSRLNHYAESDGEPTWKKAVALEIFCNLYSRIDVFFSIYRIQKTNNWKQQPFLKNNIYSFVRITAEMLSLLQSSNDSTASLSLLVRQDSFTRRPSGHSLDVTLDSDQHPNDPHNPFKMNSQAAVFKVNTLNLNEKNEQPHISDAYFCNLILYSICAIANSLARVILPMSLTPLNGAPDKCILIKFIENLNLFDMETLNSQPFKSSNCQAGDIASTLYYVPVNPLHLNNHVQYEDAVTVSMIIAEFWPALLATCSTFLQSPIEIEIYRYLIQAVQQFTLTTGFMDMTTPRDAFITMMGKASVPANVFTLLCSNVPTSHNSTEHENSNNSHRRNSNMGHSLNGFNILCIRSLVNNAIVLGPAMHGAWSILFEHLLKVNLVYKRVTSKVLQRDTHGDVDRLTGESSGLLMMNLKKEIAVLEISVVELFECSTLYDNETFRQILRAIGSLIQENEDMKEKSCKNTELSNTGSSITSPNLSGLRLNGESLTQSYIFTLDYFRSICAKNAERLVKCEASDSGWDYVVNVVQFCIFGKEQSQHVPKLGMEVLTNIVQSVVEFPDMHGYDRCEQILDMGLEALLDVIKRITDNRTNVEDWELDLVNSVLVCLRRIIENRGEFFHRVWRKVFQIVDLVLNSKDVQWEHKGKKEVNEEPKKGGRLAWLNTSRETFSVIELICCDFINALPHEYIIELINVLQRFSLQESDLNISLTTIAYFWNVSDDLHKCIATDELERLSEKGTIWCNGGDDEGMEELENEAAKGSVAAAWIILLFRLTRLTENQQAEIRNSGLQILLRIIENCGDEMTEKVWTFCVQNVLLSMLKRNAHNLGKMSVKRMIKVNGDDNNECKEIEDKREIMGQLETSDLMVSGVSRIIAGYVSRGRDWISFQTVWDRFLEVSRVYLDFGSYEIFAAVYGGMKEILEALSVLDKVDTQKVNFNGAIHVWLEYTLREKVKISNNNEVALVNYVEAFKQLYGFTGGRKHGKLTAEKISKMVENLAQCVEKADWVGYTNDVDHCTKLQNLVLESLGMINVNVDGVTSIVVGQLLEVSRAYLVRRNGTKGYTFINLSKGAIHLIEAICTKSLETRGEMIRDGGKCVNMTLEGLELIMREKFGFVNEEQKYRTLWQDATSAALVILKKLVEQGYLDNDGDVVRSVSRSVTRMCEDIVKSEGTGQRETESVEMLQGMRLSNEKFDIRALRKLMRLARRIMNQECVGCQNQRRLAAVLYKYSKVGKGDYDDDFGEVNTNDEQYLPSVQMMMKHLYTVRMGRTIDNMAVERLRMAYECLNQLFGMVMLNDSLVEVRCELDLWEVKDIALDNTWEDLCGEQDRITQTSPGHRQGERFAIAAMPYVLHRIAAPIKAYIADGSLRGELPLTLMRKQECLSVLKRLRWLINQLNRVKFDYMKALVNCFTDLVDMGNNLEDGQNGRGSDICDSRDKELQRAPILLGLHPLIIRAVEVARKRKVDVEILGELMKNLDSVNQRIRICE